MTPRRVHRLMANLTLDKDSGRYRYRNPITGKRYWLGRDRIKAEARARAYNAEVAAILAARDTHTAVPTVNSVIEQYICNVVPGKPWDDGTKKNHLFALALYQREFAGELFGALDRVRLADWISKRSRTGEGFNKHRGRWVDIYRYAISRGLTDYNEAEAVMKRSVSKKIADNRKLRTRLSLGQFRQVHEAAPGWLRIAMEIALVTCQARAEVCAMRKSDLRDGWLYIIRDKVAADSDMAFIRVRETPTIRDIWTRAWEDGLACPCLVHRRPLSMRPQHLKNKAHPFAVEPDFVTRAFGEARDAAGVAAQLSPRQRPTFHEIRALGGRLYRKAGWTRDQVQALMTHADGKTTEIYLTSPEALTDDHYRPVEATMNLKQILEA